MDVNAPGAPGIDDAVDRAWLQNWFNLRDAAWPSTSDQPDGCNGIILMSFPWHWEPDALVQRHESLTQFSVNAKYPLPDQVMARIDVSLNIMT